MIFIEREEGFWDVFLLHDKHINKFERTEVYSGLFLSIINVLKHTMVGRTKVISFMGKTENILEGKSEFYQKV